MGKTVLADPQFGVMNIMRPYVNFEDVYGGNAATIPIMLSKDGKPLDKGAGKPGYDARLLRGLAVPLGARVMMVAPKVYSSPQANEDYPYIWSIIWRFRNLFDFRTQRKSYHFPKQGVGVPETAAGYVGDRVPLGAMTQSVIYNQTEVSISPTPAMQTQNLHSENIQFGGVRLPNPLNPDGSIGAYQQGIFPTDISGSNEHTRPGFDSIEFPAMSDELLIAVTRGDNNGQTANWDFDTDDAQFSRLFGKGNAGGPFPDLGVYVLVGVAP